MLKDVGFRCFDPDGAYYVMTDIGAFGYDDDVEFAKFLVKESAHKEPVGLSRGRLYWY